MSRRVVFDAAAWDDASDDTTHDGTLAHTAATSSSSAPPHTQPPASLAYWGMSQSAIASLKLSAASTWPDGGAGPASINKKKRKKNAKRDREGKRNRLEQAHDEDTSLAQTPSLATTSDKVPTLSKHRHGSTSTPAQPDAHTTTTSPSTAAPPGATSSSRRRQRKQRQAQRAADGTAGTSSSTAATEVVTTLKPTTASDSPAHPHAKQLTRKEKKLAKRRAAAKERSAAFATTSGPTKTNAASTRTSVPAASSAPDVKSSPHVHVTTATKKATPAPQQTVLGRRVDGAARTAPRSHTGSKAAKRLHGARFRMLNEKLYTTTGSDAYSLFSANPELFDVYHQGFQTQVEKWPVNPVDRAIAWIKSKGRSIVVADLGCGDALIARSVPNTVHSFDLVSQNEHVVACDIADVPLEDNSVDVAVFCLALMGVNYVDFLKEAHRILKRKGSLLIYEVVSRIDSIDAFVETVEALGFRCGHRDATSTMFVELHFDRIDQRGSTRKPSDPVPLHPCIYKRR
eukprot:m.134174 g.134174  ORF g.134174 m.134174 type:complete len:514 (+) comp11377_c0_seq3:232-1773(+)